MNFSSVKKWQEIRGSLWNIPAQNSQGHKSDLNAGACYNGENSHYVSGGTLRSVWVPEQKLSLGSCSSGITLVMS